MPIAMTMRSSRWLAVLVSFAAVLGALTSTTQAATAAPVPGSTCTVFPARNVWNMNILKLPVNRDSAKWLRSMHASSTKLHLDFGPPAYGMPFDVVDNTHATSTVSFTYASESDHGPYPFGPDIHIEGGSDRHAIMINKDTCTLYELYAARWNAGSPTAGSGAIWDLTSNALRPRTWTSADAAGLPIFPGLIRLDEVKAGAIKHAIRFTVSCTRNRFVWPARHQAGVGNANCPPMGARFRLKAGFKMSNYSVNARVIIRAMKRYGLIVADNGSDWFFQGTVDPGWTNSLMDQLKRIPASAFVAVDEYKCQVSGGSGAYAYGPGCPQP
jgi:hypothetical protein